jgi:hypothetical protein
VEGMLNNAAIKFTEKFVPFLYKAPLFSAYFYTLDHRLTQGGGAAGLQPSQSEI